MIPLPTNRRVLMWLGLYPVDWSTSTRDEFKYMIFGSAVFAVTFSVFAGSLMFFVKFATIDPTAAFYALLQVISMLNMMYLMVFAFLQRHKIAAMIEQLSNIYNQFEHNDSFHYLAEINNQSEWIWKLYLKYAFTGWAVLVTSSVIVSILICLWTNGKIDIQQLYRPGKLSLPWNQETPLGYIGEMMLWIAAGEAYFLTLLPILLLFTSICQHHQAFAKMYRDSALKLNQPDENRNDKQFLCQLIQFHITVKDWFMETAQVFNWLIAFQLICNMLTMACCLFQMSLRFKQFHLEIVNLAIGVLNNLIILFCYCYFGKVTSESFDQMSDTLYETNWHELPIELQKYFILMIANTQRPLRYHGFNVTLDLDTFCQFLQTVYTYYMICQTLTSD